VQFVDVFPQVAPTLIKGETLMIDDMPSTDKVCASKVELKPLPFSSSYKFLSPHSTYHVIVNESLGASQVDS